MKARYLLILSFLLLTGSLQADVQKKVPYYPLNQYVQTSWTVKQDLPDNNIPDILQDQRGYIWMASYSGLIQFDSINFKTISKNNNPQFTSTTARVLFEDSRGNLWIGTNGDGLARFTDNTFTMFKKEDGLVSQNIRSITETSYGGLLLGTTAGISLLQKGRFFDITKNSSFQSQIVEMLYTDKLGQVWMGSSQKGLYQIINKQVVHYTVFPEFDQYQFLSMLEAKNGDIWLGTVEKGLIRIRNGKVTYFTHEKRYHTGPVNSLFQAQDGTIWCGTDRGVLRIKGEKVYTYTEKDGLSSNIISKVFEDRERNIWIATARGGVTKLSIGKFQSLSSQDGLINNNVNSILSIGAATWIGTDSGLSIYQQGRFIQHPIIDLIGKERIRYLHQDPKGKIWINTYGKKGVLVYSGGHLKSYNIKNGLSDNRTRVTITAKTGAHWVGTKNGLNRIHNGKITQFTEKDGLLNDYILSLYEDPKGQIWIGTDGGGVFRYAQGKFTKYGIEQGLLGGVIFKFFEDSSQNIWAATNRGISRWVKDRFISYSTQNGLKADSIFHIFEDRHHRLWMTSAKGVFTSKIEDFKKVDLQQKPLIEVKLYDIKDGLNGGILATAWGERKADGTLLIPTSSGITLINPDQIPINEIPPSVFVDEVMVNSNVVPLKDFKVLSPETQRITLNYKGLSYAKPEDVVFQYKLEGFDKDWSQPTKKREASYTSLPPGTYQFKLKAANGDDVWSNVPPPIKFVQKPHFYQTTWFLLLTIATVVGLTAIVFLVRIRILQKQKQQLEKTIAERTREIHGKNKELSKINDKITESIQYAKTIQTSVLPETGFLKKSFSDSYVLYHPRDIVGGDFYQLYKIGKKILLVIGDCTGHGVPGGFMTMMSVTLIRRIIYGKKELNPGKILYYLNRLIRESLKGNQGALKTDDGLDGAVCLVDPEENTVQFSGGNLSLVKVLFEDAVVHKGDRKGIGHRRVDPNFEYKTHTIKVDPGTSFYLYTDGITDQVGGPKRTKFGKKRLLNLFAEHHNKPFKEQKQILLDELTAYSGRNEQRDDITVIGFKIN